MEERAYLAVDLGAGSGRVILGRFGDSELRLDELHRFPQVWTQEGGHQRWAMRELLGNVEQGLAAAGKQALVDPAAIRSVGVDTWGVDYGLVDAGGELLANPVCYRDSRTDGRPAELFRRVPVEEVYASTGIQTMQLNTLFQLLAQVADGEWPAEARRLLMMPDLVHHHLCGAEVGEYTIASTSQLLSARRREWDAQLLAAIGVPLEVMPELVLPGTRLGALLPGLRAATGLANLDVVAPAAHDTASAVVGVPLAEGWAYLSSGTWSLLGVEAEAPVLTDLAREYNFTNEGGAFGKIRLLKNVTGLWILESCRELWREQGLDASHETLLAGLCSDEPGSTFLDPDDPRFLNPANMLEELHAYLRETDQAVPTDPVAMTRVILESLALRYAEVVRMLGEITGQPLHGVHVVGGGSQNDFLNQATASATGLPVRAGPVEATAIGNLLVQAIADGVFADLDAARRFVAGATEVRTFEPRARERWGRCRRAAMERKRPK